MKEQLLKTKSSLVSLDRKNEIERHAANERLAELQSEVEKQKAVVNEITKAIQGNFAKLQAETQNNNGLNVDKYQQILAYVEILQVKFAHENDTLSQLDGQLSEALDTVHGLYKEKSLFEKKMSDNNLLLDRELAKEHDIALGDLWLNKGARHD